MQTQLRVSSHLKEELAWAVNKQLWVISTTMVFKNSKSTKELTNKAVLTLKQYCMHCHVAISYVFQLIRMKTRTQYFNWKLLRRQCQL